MGEVRHAYQLPAPGGRPSVETSLDAAGASARATLWSLSFNERHLVDLFERRDAEVGFFDRRFPEERHALVSRHAFDFRRRTLVENHFADVLAQVEQFVDGGAPAEPGAAALEAARAFIELDVAPLLQVE